MTRVKAGKESRRRLLRTLVEQGPTPRAVLADHLGVTPSAVSRLVRELITAGVLEEGEKFSPQVRPGRQFVEVRFAPNALYVIGVGLEAFSQAVVMSNLNGEVVASVSLGLTSFRDEEAVFDRIATAVDDMLRETGVSIDRVIGMGIAVVGIVDTPTGRVVQSAHLGWADVPIAAEVSGRTGIPVVVENLLHSTNLAEHAFGVSKGVGSVLLIRTSLSIGASLIVDGKLVLGGFGEAGQIAHAPTIDGEEACYCGSSGCLETEASGRALLARSDQRSFKDMAAEDLGSLSKSLAELLELAKSGDAVAAENLLACGRALGRAMEWPIAVLDPDCIVLSGPVGRDPNYVTGVKEGLAMHGGHSRTTHCTLAVSMMPIRQTAIRLAIAEFLTMRDLDVERLERAMECVGIEGEGHASKRLNVGFSV